MARRPLVPPQLTLAPFTLAQAQAAGITRDHLRSAAWRHLGPATFGWTGLPEGPMVELAAVAERLPPGAAFCGYTAAWLHGLTELTPNDPIEVNAPPACGISARVGARVRRVDLDPGDIVTRRALPVMTMVRTLACIALHRSVVEAVVAADLALRRRLVCLNELGYWAAEHGRQKGVARLRRVVELANGKSESPMETQLRLLLVLNGLPTPELQVNLKDQRGRWIARADLYYSQARLVIEFDGAVHRTTLASDNRRQNKILAAGFQILRFTGADVLGNPDSVVAQVRTALATARAQPTHPYANGSFGTRS